MSIPTISEVDAIGAIGDAVIRNLRITQCYHELSQAVADRVSPGANWCTFATWASRQAGQTTRGEDFARAVDDILGSHEIATLVGEPPDGQRLLREAFIAYGNACVTPNDRQRAALLLLGNLLVGLHEQTRLQPEIQASLDASVDPEAVRAALLPLVMPGAWLRIRAQIARLTGRPMPADVAIDALVAAVRRRMRLVITDLLMTLRVPGAMLHLGRDVVGEFPAELRDVEHPPLLALLATIDPTPNATRGSGATDWSNLNERMHYIADLFRCWHGRSELFTPPYTAAQVAAMRQGRRPDGDL